MNRKHVLVMGVTGTVITGICCFTPALVVLMGAVGLGAWLVWLDYVLIPALIVFIGMAGAALAVKERGKNRGLK